MPPPRPISTKGNCGCSGVHPATSAFPVLAAPVESGGKLRNTIRQELTTVACWRMDDAGFEFGSSFVRSDTRDDFHALANLRQQFPAAPISVFGHADPVGDDSFNKQLAGHRANSIYAILTRNTAIWESLYSSGSSEGWGQPALAHILSALGYPASSDYSTAVRQFQQDHALSPVDGIAGSHTRAALFAAYMDFLCPATWSRADFLSRGADPSGKGDIQGCGEFNPARVLSSSELSSLSSEDRNAANSVNRRVVIFFFRPGTVVPPDRWPCPRINESTSGCLRRLWSDGNTRRANSAERREFAETLDTFACRFYHRLAAQSPCEGVEPQYVELVIPLEEDLDDDPYEPDRVRLRQLDGPYLSELVEGGPNVRKDGKNPLHFYHFQLVPPGLYTVEVFAHKHWHTILSGLSVSTAGAFLGARSFEDSSNGDQMGSPDELLIDEIPDTPKVNFGCC